MEYRSYFHYTISYISSCGDYKGLPNNVSYREILRDVQEGALGGAFKESGSEGYLSHFTWFKCDFWSGCLKRDSSIISAINILLKHRTMCRPSLANWALKMSASWQNHSPHLLIYIVAHSRIIVITLEIVYVNSSSHNSGFSLISSSKAIRYWLKIIPAALSVAMVAHLLPL